MWGQPRQSSGEGELSQQAVLRVLREPEAWARAALGDLTFWQVLLPPPVGASPQDSSLSLSLSRPPWCRFGGGPAVNHLYVCSICQVEIEALAKRRRVEIDTFIKVCGAGEPGSWDRRAQCSQAQVVALFCRRPEGQRPCQTVKGFTRGNGQV